MTGTQSYPLHQALPPDVLVGGNTVWSRYRQYPVFSLKWFLGRSLLFACLVGPFAALVALGVGFGLRDYGAGLASAAHLFVAFMLMATTGPALATWVRHRRWPLRRERIGIAFAVLLGMGASLAADRWASAYSERQVEQAMGDRYKAMMRDPDTIDPLERTLVLAANIAALAVVYGLFGGGLALRAYFGEQRRWERSRMQRELEALQQEKREADLRLGVLQAQVEPHFLFNTLASVRALVRHDPDGAEATLDALVKFLRASIPKLRDGASGLHATLGQQLDLCADYLEVMRLRMGGRLSYSVEADAALRRMPFPPAVLITLVENAIKHGIEPQPGPGRVEIRAEADLDTLRVLVTDDGAGLKPGMGGGVGLANLRRQLLHRFGTRASLRLRPLGAGTRGVQAEIRLPLEAA